MKPKAYVLLSGGIDSTTCLYLAHKQFNGNVVGLSLFYGQRHMKEMEYARKSCDQLHVEHRIINLSGIVGKTMLTDPHSEVPNISYAEIEGVSPTYVPFRNGLLLSAVASVVHGEYVDALKREGIKQSDYEWSIFFGAHAEDAHNWAYPDCTAEFTGSMANAIYLGTYHAVRLRTPLQWLNKPDIVKLGEELKVDWANTWSCYKGQAQQCGVCPTCRSRREGFRLAGVADPTVYSALAA